MQGHELNKCAFRHASQTPKNIHQIRFEMSFFLFFRSTCQKWQKKFAPILMNYFPVVSRITAVCEFLPRELLV
jgi:hypothetical protein